MKRGAPLRRTALVAKVPLQRGGQLARSGLASTKRIARKPMARVARYTGPSTRERAIVAARDGGCCVVCGESATDQHHRLPRGMGGAKSDPRRNAPSRLVCLCRLHHAQVESHRIWAYARGLLVHRGADPALAPIVLHGKGLCLLNDEGGIEVLAV